MKKSNRTVRKMRSAWTGFAAACLAAALTMSALVSCAPQESRPVVTSDDLTPPSAAQEAIAQDIGGGKNYEYYWAAEHIEEELEAVRESTEQSVKHWKEIADTGNYYGREVSGDEKEELKNSFDEMLNEIPLLQEEKRKLLESELALDPVVSAQEAANAAGAVFEKIYGIELSQDILTLSCVEINTNINPGEEVIRSVWNVSREEAADGVLFSTNAVGCTLDATTGEFISVDYTPSNDELTEMWATELPSCFVKKTSIETTGSYGYWNETEASYAEVAEKLKQQTREQLSGSMLIGGAAVTDVRVELLGKMEDSGENQISLLVEGDNGKTYQLYRNYSMQAYVNYGFEGYPLRAYWFRNNTYLNGK